jgi:hypothetical protein
MPQVAEMPAAFLMRFVEPRPPAQNTVCGRTLANASDQTARRYASPHFGTIHLRASWFCGRELHMIIFMENIEPPLPLVPQTDDEIRRLRLEALTVEDRWVRNFIDRLAGVDRDTKH